MDRMFANISDFETVKCSEFCRCVHRYRQGLLLIKNMIAKDAATLMMNSVVELVKFFGIKSPKFFIDIIISMIGNKTQKIKQVLIQTHTVNKVGLLKIGFCCFNTLYVIPFVFNVDILNLSMKIMPRKVGAWVLVEFAIRIKFRE